MLQIKALKNSKTQNIVSTSGTPAELLAQLESLTDYLIGYCPRIAIENPVPLKCFSLPPYTQITQPCEHGDPWLKRTCLWLKGLPKLAPTKLVEPQGLWVGSTSANRDPTIYQRYALHGNRDPKRRAKTFPGIARAMAEQWAGQAELVTV